MKAAMDFNFMLTRADQTIEDCLEVYDSIRDLGLRHLGFKDIGASTATLRELNRRMQSDGATTYLEVVSIDASRCLESARAAKQIGVHRVLGGVNAEEMLRELEGSGIEYLPFPGVPSGHPTRLGGTAASIAQDCSRFATLGCAGVDLLAYRATAADPLDLVRAARAATPGYLLVAGSVESQAQIAALAEAGANGFTVGSAAFAGMFAPRRGSLRGQILAILEMVKALPESSSAP